jgi:hypothetical protein
MHALSLESAKRRLKRILIVAGAALTLGASAVPVEASAHGRPAGAGVGHRIG